MLAGFALMLLVFYFIIQPFKSDKAIYSSPDNKEKYIPRENLLFHTGKDTPYFQKVKIKEKIFFSHSPFGELSVFDEVADTEQHRYLYIETRIQCSTEGLKQKEVSEINFANVSIDALDNKNLRDLNIGQRSGFTIHVFVKLPYVIAGDFL